MTSDGITRKGVKSRYDDGMDIPKDDIEECLK